MAAARTAIIAALIVATAGSAWANDGAAMRSFGSDKAVERYLKRIEARPVPVYAPPPIVLAVPSPAMDAIKGPPGTFFSPSDDSGSMQESASAVTSVSADVIVTGTKIDEPNITNTQEKGVDEGGIVKVHGRHLVVLRRGRLFTIDTAGSTLRKVDQADAFPPGDVEADSAWYDEMLVSGDLVVVIGYSYGRSGTEINRFRIDDAGKLRYLDTHHIRSDDYYSDRNYASRLVGDQLVVYSPIPLSYGDSWRDSLPAVRRWTGPTDRDDENASGPGGFKRLAPASRIYLAEPLWRARDVDLDTFHAVTICDAASPKFDCTGSAVLGSDSRTFYVSQQAVYVWTGNIDLRGRGEPVSFVYRLPLDGSDPQAIGAWGGPVDQFSFREDRREGMLNVVVRADSGGDKMWRPELSDGDAALLRLPLAAFGDGSSTAAKRAYRDLPAKDYGFHNRYVGRHLLYSTDDYGEESGGSGVRAVPLDGGPIRWVPLPHGVSRLDVIGSDGVAIGVNNKAALGFSAIRLDPASGDAIREDTYLFPDASEGENRSQAFFYQPAADDPTGTSGTMALPISRDLAGTGREFLGSGAAIAFLNRTRRKLSPAGELAANTAGAVEDSCIASCVDWYGNARPIFLGNRIFALMGYELVEGRMEVGRIAEQQRLDFAPATSRVGR